MECMDRSADAAKVGITGIQFYSSSSACVSMQDYAFLVYSTVHSLFNRCAVSQVALQVADLQGQLEALRAEVATEGSRADTAEAALQQVLHLPGLSSFTL